MYCKNCGAELRSDARFCLGCGVAVDEQATEPSQKQKAVKGNKKLLISIIAGVACITIVFSAIMLFSSSGGYSTPEEAAENFVMGYFSGDAETLLSSVPDFMVRELARSYDVAEDDMDALVKVMEAEQRESDVGNCVLQGSNSSVNYSRELSNYIEDMRDGDYNATPAELAKIEEYQIVEVYVSVDNKNRDFIVFCVNYDGSWYAVDID